MAYVELNSNINSNFMHKKNNTSKQPSNTKAARIMQIVLVVCLVADLTIVTVKAQQPARCFTLCRRSENNDVCRRCRFREPLRFGKRDPIDSGIDTGNLMQVSPSLGSSSAESSGGQSSSSVGISQPVIRELLIKRIRERLLELEPLVTRLAALRANQDTLNAVDPL